MFTRTVPAFAAGIAFALMAGSGITYATTHGSGSASPKMVTKYASIKSATRSYDASGVAIDRDEDGLTDAIAAYSGCPKGTQMTGGGISDSTSTGWMLMNAPDTEGSEGWVVAVAVNESVTEDPGNLWASVTCWSPKGNPPGGYRTGTSAPAEPLPAGLVRELKAFPVKH